MIAKKKRAITASLQKLHVVFFGKRRKNKEHGKNTRDRPGQPLFFFFQSLSRG
jgi:hypothetical protein